MFCRCLCLIGGGWWLLLFVHGRQVANGTWGEQLCFVDKLCLAGRLIPLLATCRKKRR